MNATVSPSSWAWRPDEGYFDASVVVVATSCLVAMAGAAGNEPLFIGAGAAGLCVALRQWELFYSPRRTSRLKDLASRLLRNCGPYDISGGVEPRTVADENGSRQAPSSGPSPDGPDDSDRQHAAESLANPPASTASLLAEMLQNNRYALLLRPETADHLSRDEYLKALHTLDDRMAITPEGDVLVGMAAERATLGDATAVFSASTDANEGIAHVGACYFDRYAVTNADYQFFVDAGGYEQLEFWPEEALPALFDFVDTTGCSAPRYWSDGRFAYGEDRLPVVGVSWYEAVAYARWVGKRLPTDAEWTKACAWPIASAPGRIAQRRYPWGESFDARRANLWCTGHGRPLDVDAHAEGATVGGLHQMVGNVWEWTADTLDAATSAKVRFPSALRSIRGGAYNTYFENQATCHFQSGEHPLARRANIGVRLAIDMAGLASPSD
ncbi:MAG: SUMF1/EgtB/PvdO family nonheme iron enzyme [Planctomycetota bacterium]